MTVIIDGGAGITFPDTVQQTNALTNTGGLPKYYAARAWVSFIGSSFTPTINTSSNVSSVSNRGTGLFTINFTSAMPDAGYVVAGAAYDSTAQNYIISMDTAPATTAAYVRISRVSFGGSPSVSLVNPDLVTLVFFR